MRIRNNGRNGPDRVEQQMTPMIDIVFQLLTFFIMSFQIAPLEGDFQTRMPLAGPGTRDALPPLIVRLVSGADGELARIQFGEAALPDMASLRQRVIDVLGQHGGPGSRADALQVEFDCDYNLRYEHLMAAVTAVSGYVDAKGRIVKLIGHVNFAPPRRE